VGIELRDGAFRVQETSGGEGVSEFLVFFWEVLSDFFYGG